VNIKGVDQYTAWLFFGKTWVGRGQVFFEKIKSKLKNIFQISDMLTHFCKSI